MGLNFTDSPSHASIFGDGFIYSTVGAVGWRRTPGAMVVERGEASSGVPIFYITFRSVFPRVYRCTIRGLRPITNDATASFYWRGSFDGGATYVQSASSYDDSAVYAGPAIAPNAFGSVKTHAAFSGVFPASGTPSNLEMDIWPGGSGQAPVIQTRFGHQHTGGPLIVRSSAFLNQAGRLTNVMLYCFNGSVAINLKWRSWELVGVL